MTATRGWRRPAPAVRSGWPGLARQHGRSAVVLAVAQLTNLGAVAVVAWAYAPAEFGGYATMLAVAAVVGGVSSLRLDVAATTASAAAAAVLVRTACRSNLIAGAAVTAVAVAWSLLTGPAGADPYPQGVVDGVATGVATATLGLSVTLTYARVRERRYGLVAGSKLLIAVVQAAVQVGLGLVLPTAGALLVGSALAYGAGAVLLARRPAAPAVPTERTGTVLRRYRGFVVAAAPAGLVNSLALNLPVLMVGAALGSVVAADLALALRIGLLPLALVGQALMPILFGEVARAVRVAPERGRHSYDRAVATLSAVGCVCLPALSLVVFVAAPRILGEQWAGVGPMLLLLTPFMVGQFAVAPLSQTLNAVGRNAEQLAWDTARLLATALAFLPVVLGRTGLGTGVALFSAAMVVAYAVHVVLCRRALRAVVPRPQPVATATERGEWHGAPA